jgi:hypothetical protein
MDYAYYASDWIWPTGQSDLMKSMLLFFDGIAMALPPDLATETIGRNEVLAVPLFDKGLLINFDPNDVLDYDSATSLIEALRTLVQSVELDRFMSSGEEMSITASHWARERAPEVARLFESELIERGLMRDAGAGDLVWLPPEIRLLVLVLFAQALRGRLLDRDVDIHPVTDSSELASNMRNLLGRPDFSDSGNIVTPGWQGEWSDYMDPQQVERDLLDVGVDLSAVPLDEVLDFRRENGMHYRAYASALHQFLVTSAALHPAERKRILAERSEQIRDQAAELRRISRRAFSVNTGMVAISLVGVAAVLGNPLPAVLALVMAVLPMLLAHGETATAYSYLLKTRRL